MNNPWVFNFQSYQRGFLAWSTLTSRVWRLWLSNLGWNIKCFIHWLKWLYYSVPNISMMVPLGWRHWPLWGDYHKIIYVFVSFHWYLTFFNFNQGLTKTSRPQFMHWRHLQTWIQSSLWILIFLPFHGRWAKKKHSGSFYNVQRWNLDNAGLPLPCKV